jgi:hypothetical protein
MVVCGHFIKEEPRRIRCPTDCRRRPLEDAEEPWSRQVISSFVSPFIHALCFCAVFLSLINGRTNASGF